MTGLSMAVRRIELPVSTPGGADDPFREGGRTTTEGVPGVDGADA